MWRFYFTIFGLVLYENWGNWLHHVFILVGPTSPDKSTYEPPHQPLLISSKNKYESDRIRASVDKQQSSVGDRLGESHEDIHHWRTWECARVIGIATPKPPLSTYFLGTVPFRRGWPQIGPRVSVCGHSDVGNAFGNPSAGTDNKKAHCE